MTGIRRTVSRPFWEAAERGELVLQSCEATGRRVFYPRSVCPYCSGCALPWSAHDGHGLLETWTVVANPQPGVDVETPYAVGIGVFGGARMFGVIACAGDLRCDLPIRFEAGSSHETRGLASQPYVFAALES